MVGEDTDVTRWSTASLLTQRATVGPFGGGEEHRFYIEALDNNGLRSLGIVRFQVVQSSLEQPLLIVDDTRFNGDERDAGEEGIRGAGRFEGEPAGRAHHPPRHGISWK